MYVYQVLDSAELKRFHYVLLTISSLIYMFTALNVMLIGAVIRPIITEWNLNMLIGGYLISIGFLGMFFGAIIFGIGKSFK